MFAVITSQNFTNSIKRILVSSGKISMLYAHRNIYYSKNLWLVMQAWGQESRLRDEREKVWNEANYGWLF